MNDPLVGEALKVHAAAACVTVNVVPAIVSVPVRFVVAVCAATLKPTPPLPLPVAPLVTVIQLALLAADQAQPDPAVTALLPVPPLAGNDPLVGEALKVHAAAACVTVNVVPATVSVPVRF